MAVYNRLIRAAAFNVIDLKKTFTIGLTGQTGAGKGYVCEYFEALGFKIIDCDKVVKKLYKENKDVIDALKAEFGDNIVRDGRLDTAALAEIVFSDKGKTERLNRIVHPFVTNECKRLAGGLCVIDAPQLFEANIQDMCYKVISVTAPEKTRLARILERDGITEKQAKSRMNAQLDEDYYINNSDFVIINDGRDIKNQIDRILEAIL